MDTDPPTFFGLKRPFSRFLPLILVQLAPDFMHGLGCVRVCVCLCMRVQGGTGDIYTQQTDR